MCKETTEKVYYLYKHPNGYFIVNQIEDKDFIISSFNEKYMNGLMLYLNFLVSRGIEITNEALLKFIIDSALDQDKECYIRFNGNVFNKE